MTRGIRLDEVESDPWKDYVENYYFDTGKKGEDFKCQHGNSILYICVVQFSLKFLIRSKLTVHC